MENQTHQEYELPLDSAGTRLRNARASAGLSLADIASETKIAKRHLTAIEEDRFSDLVSRTYAVGFARAYARAVGLDERDIADAVRTRLRETEPSHRPARETFEPGDPARVPPARLAWIAGLGAVVVIVLVIVFWTSFLAPAGTLPDITDEAPQPVVAAAPAPAGERAGPPVPVGGEVVFTALEPDIWVKFYDASGTQLFQKEMAQGESYRVPADAAGPQIWTGRPDALKITVGGKPVPKLAEGPVLIKDRPVTAQALLAQDAQGDAPAAPVGRTASPQPPGDELSRSQPAEGRPVVAAAPSTTAARKSIGVGGSRASAEGALVAPAPGTSSL